MIASRLPSFIALHLARLAKPFDADDWLFEAKWDGTRVLAIMDKASCCSRREAGAPLRGFVPGVNQPGACAHGDV